MLVLGRTSDKPTREESQADKLAPEQSKRRPKTELLSVTLDGTNFITKKHAFTSPAIKLLSTELKIVYDNGNYCMMTQKRRVSQKEVWKKLNSCFRTRRVRKADVGKQTTNAQRQKYISPARSLTN